MSGALVTWLLVAATVVSSATPLGLVQSSVGRALVILQDRDGDYPAAYEQRRLVLRRVSGELCNFSEMARRAAGRYWQRRSVEQRDALVRLVTDRFDAWYFGKLEAWAGDRISYGGETVDGNFATVRSTIVRSPRSSVSVTYRLSRTGNRWAVYDVVFEGVSFVSMYRNQYDDAIRLGGVTTPRQKLQPVQKLQRDALRESRPSASFLARAHDQGAGAQRRR